MQRTPFPVSPISPIEYSALQDRNATPRQSTEQLPPVNSGESDSCSTGTTVEAKPADSHKTKPARQPSPNASPFIWWLEGISCLLVIGGLVGIMGTVYALDTKPLPQWPYRLSVNTFLAAFSVLIKASCGLVLAEGISHLKWTRLRRPQPLRAFDIHDEASRGPWGAVRLLATDLGRSISSLEAMVTICTLFLEPFSQQIVSFRDCVQSQELAAASIARVKSFDAAEIRPGFLPNVKMPAHWDLVKLLNQAMYATSMPELSFECETGNYTFPEYNSLAFCHSCYDNTSDLVVSAWPQNRVGPYPNMALPARPGGMQLSLATTYGMPVRSVLQLPQRPVMIARGGFPIGVIRVLNWQKNATYAAYSCDISPCVKNYTANIRGHQLTESEGLTQGIVPFQTNGSTSLADLNCTDSDTKQHLQDLGYDLATHKRWLPYNVTILRDRDEKSVKFIGTCDFMSEAQARNFCETGDKQILKKQYAELIPAECIYSTPEDWKTKSFQKQIGMLFNGYVQNWNSTDQADASSDRHSLMTMWHAGSGNGTFEDIDGFVKTLADALTIYVRNRGSSIESNVVQGEAQYNTVCIHVRCVWLIHSTAVVALTLVFFVWVVVHSKREQACLAKVWQGRDLHASYHDFKSSALTLLLHGFDEGSQRALQSIGSTNRQEELDQLAKTTQIELIATEQGWKISTTNT